MSNEEPTKLVKKWTKGLEKKGLSNKDASELANMWANAGNESDKKKKDEPMSDTEGFGCGTSSVLMGIVGWIIGTGIFWSIVCSILGAVAGIIISFITYGIAKSIFKKKIKIQENYPNAWRDKSVSKNMGSLYFVSLFVFYLVVAVLVWYYLSVTSIL